MKYAQIVRGVVHGVYTYDPLPDFAPNILMIPLEEVSEVTQGWIYDGVSFSPPVPTPASVDTYIAALELFYDQKAKERGYDSRFTCALRAGYQGPFQGEATAFAIWMDTCNMYARTVLADVEGGNRAIPTEQQLIDELPVLVWPQ